MHARLQLLLQCFLFSLKHSHHVFDTRFFAIRRHTPLCLSPDSKGCLTQKRDDDDSGLRRPQESGWQLIAARLVPQRRDRAAACWLTQLQQWQVAASSLVLYFLAVGTNVCGVASITGFHYHERLGWSALDKAHVLGWVVVSRPLKRHRS